MYNYIMDSLSLPMPPAAPGGGRMDNGVKLRLVGFGQPGYPLRCPGPQPFKLAKLSNKIY